MDNGWMGTETERGQGGVEWRPQSVLWVVMKKNKGHGENGDYRSVQVAPGGCFPKPLHSSVMDLPVKLTGKVTLSSPIQCLIQAGLIGCDSTSLRIKH